MDITKAAEHRGCQMKSVLRSEEEILQERSVAHMINATARRADVMVHILSK